MKLYQQPSFSRSQSSHYMNQSKQGQVSIPSTSQVKDALKRSGVNFDNFVRDFFIIFGASILAQLIVERLIPKKEVVQSESFKPSRDSNKGLASTTQRQGISFWDTALNALVTDIVTKLLAQKKNVHTSLDKGDYAFREGMLHDDRKQLKKSIDHYLTASNEGELPLRHYAQAMKIFAREALDPNRSSHKTEAKELLQVVGKDDTNFFSALFNAFSSEEKDVKNEKRKRLMTTFLHTDSFTEPFLVYHLPAASSPLVIHGYDMGNFQVVDLENGIPTESYLDEYRRTSRMRGGTRPDFWHAVYFYPTPISGLLHLLPKSQAIGVEKTLYRNNMDHLKHNMVMDAARAIRTDQMPRLYNEFGRGLEKRRLVQEYTIG
jgi:hypothetical protein